jgi:hypothetical protein
MFGTGITLLLGTTLFHFLVIALLGRLPRLLGLLLVAAYGLFLYLGLLRT